MVKYVREWMAMRNWMQIVIQERTERVSKEPELEISLMVVFAVSYYNVGVLNDGAERKTTEGGEEAYLDRSEAPSQRQQQ